MSYRIEVITLMPELWPPLLSEAAGVSGRAVAEGRVDVEIANLRDFGTGRHLQVDDTPFGGGAGMVLQVGPLHRAIERARARTPGPVLLLSPRGEPFCQDRAQALADGPGFTLVCGRYEGFDERVRHYVNGELSVGDFVLTGGDPAAWCVLDACIRLRPGVLGNAESAPDESFSRGGLEHPHYTRPAVYEGMEVPEVLRSGDHARIRAWREAQAQAITAARRPDLLPKEP